MTEATRQPWTPRHPDAKEIAIALPAGSVLGYAKPGTEALVQCFVDNFERGEVGASFSLVEQGALIVDLWGGFANPKQSLPWDEKTLAVFFSCSKILSALVVHELFESGRITPTTPLAEIWPESEAAQLGATVEMALAHTIGLPALSHKLRTGAYHDQAYMALQLGRQKPFWEPGTKVGYQPITFGFTLNEIVRRVSGETIGQRLQALFAEPLGLDLYVGLPEPLFERVAPIRLYRPEPGDVESRVSEACREIGSIQNLWMFNSGGWTVPSINTAEGLVPEIPAATGVGNARSLAALLALFNDEDKLRSVGLGPDTRARLEAVSSATHRDQTLLCRTRFSMGMMKSMDNREDPRADNFIIGDRAFGHVGHGGSFGFVDRDAGISAAYVMNQQGPGILVNARGQSLIDASYRYAGFSGIAGGCWQR